LKESSGNWVDVSLVWKSNEIGSLTLAQVRDVALAHYKALTVPAAGGERFVVSNGPFNGQDVVDIIHSFPGPALDVVPKGTPGAGKEINAKANVFSGEKAHKVLGIDYTDLRVCLEDMYKSLQEKFDEKHVKDHRA
jgi:nucleoside-diphosphate-sugar epimerase